MNLFISSKNLNIQFVLFKLRLRIILALTFNMYSYSVTVYLTTNKALIKSVQEPDVRKNLWLSSRTPLK